ncbi:hypothetical protein LSAT2_006138 [Lamellibrachia satsuma]|nr:hypothetical protein LSAT2_006138 [Lamellibrachia satsuma]
MAAPYTDLPSDGLLSLNVLAATVASQVVNVVFEYLSLLPAACCRHHWLLKTLPANVGLACMLEEIIASVLVVDNNMDSAVVAFYLSLLYSLLAALKNQPWTPISNQFLAYNTLYVFFLSWTMMATMLWLENSPRTRQAIYNARGQLRSSITKIVRLPSYFPGIGGEHPSEHEITQQIRLVTSSPSLEPMTSVSMPRSPCRLTAVAAADNVQSGVVPNTATMDIHLRVTLTMVAAVVVGHLTTYLCLLVFPKYYDHCDNRVHEGDATNIIIMRVGSQHAQTSAGDGGSGPSDGADEGGGFGGGVGVSYGGGGNRLGGGGNRLGGGGNRLGGGGNKQGGSGNRLGGGGRGRGRDRGGGHNQSIAGQGPSDLLAKRPSLCSCFGSAPQSDDADEGRCANCNRRRRPPSRLTGTQPAATGSSHAQEPSQTPRERQCKSGNVDTYEVFSAPLPEQCSSRRHWNTIASFVINAGIVVVLQCVKRSAMKLNTMWTAVFVSATLALLYTLLASNNREWRQRTFTTACLVMLHKFIVLFSMASVLTYHSVIDPLF